MKINNSKNRLSHIIAFFVMLLFAMCLTMNVLLGGNYNLYESLDNTTVIETWTISESVAANQDSDNTTYFKPLFFNVNNLIQATTTYSVFTFNWHGVPCAFLHSGSLT